MTRWPGQWPGAWPGDWQGGQEASPFANMAMRATASGSLTATLDAVGGGPVYADLALFAQGSGALVGTLDGGAVAAPVFSGGWDGAPRKRKRKSEYAELQMVAAGRGTVARATLSARVGIDTDAMLADIAARTTQELERHRQSLRKKRDEEAVLLALL